MQVRTVGRVALDRWLRIVRLPFDLAAHMLPEDRGPRNAAMLAVDRVDASVRAAAGDLLDDDALRDEALRRRTAADERQHALELRARAEERAREADGQLADDLDRAAQLRADAEHKAERARAKVAKTTAARRMQVKETAAAQARTTDQDLAARVDADQKRAKKTRLTVLDEQADALDREADALTAADEAQRLGNAAGSAKARRKGTA